MKSEIFIHGILQRSGTNLLTQILMLHPDCVRPAIKLREDWFLHYSDPLYEYADKLFQKWDTPSWAGEPYSETKFYSTVGASLLKYLRQGVPDADGKVLLSKTPSVQNIERCFQLFPGRKVVIIIRDPRDIAISAFNTWKIPFDQTIINYNEAFSSIVNMEKESTSKDYLILRFEDLILEREEWTKKCLDFLDLDEKRFHWKILDKLPVFGSSEEDSWKIKNKKISFQPIGRWKSLPTQQLENLSKPISESLGYFGYPVSPEEEINPLPTLQERLKQNILIPKRKQTIRRSVNIPYRRYPAFRTGLSIMIEAILGRRINRQTKKMQELLYEIEENAEKK